MAVACRRLAAHLPPQPTVLAGRHDSAWACWGFDDVSGASCVFCNPLYKYTRQKQVPLTLTGLREHFERGHIYQA